VERALLDELISRLNRDGAALSAQFGLRYRAIEAERPRVKRRYGVCYADGTIRIRLYHAATGKPLKYSSLVNTLCHELAHLKHFNHGLRFQRFYRQILEYARAARIYLPAPTFAQDSIAIAPRIRAHALRRATQTNDAPRRVGRARRETPPAGPAPLQLALFDVERG
jgi:hypothetical protein